MTTMDTSSTDGFFLDLDGGPTDPRFYSGAADELVTAQAAEPAPAGEPIPAPVVEAPAAPVAAIPTSDGYSYSPEAPVSPNMSEAFRAGVEAHRARARAARTARPEMTEAQRAHLERIESERRTRALVDGAITVALGASDGQYPNGCLVAWHPAGKRTWSVVAAAAEVAGFSPPTPRSHRAVASAAVRALESQGLKVQTVKRGAEWSVYRPAAVSALGESVGEARLLAALVGEELTLAGPDDLCAVVRGVWDAARAQAMVGSTEITAWLANILHNLRAVPTAYGRWVPPGACSERWCTLAAALAAARLPVPSRPAGVASREDMREEITAGLIGEVDGMVSAIRAQRARAVAGGSADKPRDLGARAATTALDEITALLGKLSVYECLTGPLTETRRELANLQTELLPLVDDTVQMGMMIEMDGPAGGAA